MYEHMIQVQIRQTVAPLLVFEHRRQRILAYLTPVQPEKCSQSPASFRRGPTTPGSVFNDRQSIASISKHSPRTNSVRASNFPSLNLLPKHQ